MRISLVVAVAENGVIGRDGGLPWRLSSDLKRFKAITMGKPLVMGRKTYESIGRPLPGRPNIVISRDRDFAVDGVEAANTVEAALERASDLAREAGVDEIMVIGGEQIFRETLPLATRIYLSEVHAEVDGDARFPEYDRLQWRESECEHHPAGENDSADHSYVVLDRTPSHPA